MGLLDQLFGLQGEPDGWAQRMQAQMQSGMISPSPTMYGAERAMPGSKPPQAGERKMFPAPDAPKMEESRMNLGGSAPVAAPSSGTAWKGALKGFAEGGLFGAIAGSMDAQDQVTKQNELYQTLVSGGVEPRTAQLMMKQPQAYKVIEGLQEKRKEETRASQTAQWLARRFDMPLEQASVIAGDRELLQKYLAPPDPMQDLERRKTEAEIARLERDAKGGSPDVLTKGAPAGTMWNDPADPSKGVSPIPGAEKVPKPPTAIQTEAAKAEMAFNSLIPSIDEYVNTVRQYGAEAMPGKGKDLMGQQLRNIQLQLKEAYNLGVLNGPDLALMEQMLFDPRIGLNPMDWANSFNAVGRTEQSAEELKKILARMRDTKVQQAGGEVAPTAQAEAGPARIATDDDYARLPSGTRFIDPEGNERVKP